ncbi:MAG: hypothetical protein PHH77_02135 [Victivallaceae bacterium]|nr:hypothetical protein [Victivallaceae bacterium]
MKKHVMDGSRIHRKLKQLAMNAIGVLNDSRSASSCYEAGELRRGLRGALSEKEEKSEEAVTDELVSTLEKVAGFLKDPERSFKSEDFKKLGDEITGFLEKIKMNFK